MCGIAGFIDFTGKSSREDLGRMIKTLNHRGPDDCGIHVQNVGGALVGMAHARLSIIDLSEGGHQPMRCNHLSIVFNGEIYNFKEIRSELKNKGYRFISDSDTEVILNSFHEWGIKCVDRFIGMFAFFLIDEKANKGYLFRDRTGVKPLFCYKKNGLILFASELKAFHEHGEFEKIENRSVLRNFFDLGYIPSTECIFENAFKILPGQYCSIDLNTGRQHFETYWDPASFYKKPKLNINYLDAKEHFHSLLKSACNYRMVADVPVGVFLSGGYDSTAVTSILQHERSDKLKTFTIGFEYGNNEAPFALETSKFLGTDHYELTCTTKQAQDIIPELPFYFDEPFADSSAIPTFLVSKFARSHVTVALSADGGDELLAGYNRYNLHKLLLDRIGRIPQGMGSLFGIGKSVFNTFGKEHIAYKLDTIEQTLKLNGELPKGAYLYDKMQRMPNSIYEKLFNYELTPVRNNESFGSFQLSDYPLYNDYINYLPGDILTKVDRASMSVGLEGREPLLDHRLFEFAATLPHTYKSNGQIGKILLKDIVHEYVPKEMMHRPKTGFTIPLTQWFQTGLKDLLFDTMLENDKDGLFKKNAIPKLLDGFMKGDLHYKPLIWKLLMYNLWRKRWM